ncbi:Acetyl esterase/lipase [Dyadobacter koreensis]|uniref:Acetyl esterase/lipase n=1 Tax=Dyadobacter koreensis TaxID=408657 RepID=A0A1H7B510_9BACT|nr:alpha/beta hydrolase [Dyadobacter koreensis]SEJ72803.1 Acetyl esterase/lipase [Dyadobacter koreensis]
MNLKNISITLLTIGLSLTLRLTADAQTFEEKPLWPSGIKDNPVKYTTAEEMVNFEVNPESISKKNRVFRKVSVPTYVLHLPPPGKETGVAVVICPGGGFVDNWFDREGTDLALWLKERGVASLVLKYRLNSRDSTKNFVTPRDTYFEAAFDDAKQAIITLRKDASKLKIDPNKIGIAGFSAGGTLAVELAATDDVTKDPGKVSWKPNFAGLFYGALLKNYSVHKESCPPVFIINAHDDKLTTAAKSVEFYSSLLKAGISAEMHIYNKGSHGFAMDFTKGETLKYWPESFLAWLTDIGMIQKK